MDSPNTVVIDLEVQIKKLQEGLKEAEGEIKGFTKKAGKGNKGLAKDYDALTKAVKDYAAAKKEAAKVADQAARKQEAAAKKEQDDLKKKISMLDKIKGKLKDLSKKDLSGGFFGGLSRGSGLAGIYGKMREGNRLHRAGGAIGRGVVGGASALGGFFMGGMQQGYNQYMQYGMARFGMTGLGFSPGQYRRGMRGAGGRLGFSPTQSATMTPMIAAQTGAASTGMAQQLALAGGFGPGRVGEAASFMGTMRQAGDKFTGAENQAARRKDLSKAVAAGMMSGLEKSRVPEFFGSVRGLVQSQFGTAAGKVDSIGIAKQLAEMGKAGGAGFQGERGARIMGQLDSMIRRPGGGEAGQAVILQAMGFGKPGGSTNYYDALKMQQKGIRDPQNVKRVMEEVYKQRGVVEAGGSDPRNKEANLQFSTISGLSLEIVEKLKDIHASSMTDTEKQEEIKKTLKDAEPIDKQALRVSKEGFAGIAKHMAGVESKMIILGSKIAPMMMKFQDLQLTVLENMAKFIPDVIKLLKDIFDMLRTVGALIIGGDVGKALQKITAMFDDRERKLERTQPRSIQELASKYKNLALNREQMHRRKMAGAAKGRGGIGGIWDTITGTTRKNIAQVGAAARNDPQLQAQRKIQLRALQLRMSVLKRLKDPKMEQYASRNPEFVKEAESLLKGAGASTGRGTEQYRKRYEKLVSKAGMYAQTQLDREAKEERQKAFRAMIRTGQVFQIPMAGETRDRTAKNPSQRTGRLRRDGVTGRQ